MWKLGICAKGNVARKNEEIKGQVEEAAAETTENSASTELKPPQDKPIPNFSPFEVSKSKRVYWHFEYSTKIKTFLTPTKVHQTRQQQLDEGLTKVVTEDNLPLNLLTRNALFSWIKSLSEAIEYARKPVNYTFEEAISDDFQDDYATEILKPLDELSLFTKLPEYIQSKRRGSVAAATNKVVKAAGAALTVRPGNEMENGFGVIHQQQKENLINIITKGTIVSEAEQNRVLAGTKDTTERFNGADLMSNGGVDNSHNPLHSELGCIIKVNYHKEIINFMAESNAKQERLMSIATTLATQETTQAVPQNEADDMINSLELPFNDF
ncbi:hypothetical protein DAPPUDRAFT_250623 [Daphnia pulex]|uniref:Uncharacterized protein n=1 Tax=Daphnia pulex TaxID=6669 RepID=E9GYZ5_DAPPU|nr:hypothetical protein DAPPUDRAFT_250623 [Daphnia pulex]|eukprot:EFX75240.1 hypothetical protein DAPPUDRAFT_250623 [Daphnia pulex]